jgi:hypothetical protein
MHPECDILHVDETLGSSGCLTGGLNSRQQQSDEHADDCNHHK